MTSKNTTPGDDYDSPWKEILDLYFPQFMTFFFPKLYRKIDWTAGYEILEQELRQIARDAATGKRVVDKLIKVRTLNGDPLHIFIHIEIQNDRDVGFPLRMFVYYYRIFDQFRESVLSLAILGDDDPGWRPESYEHELWGNRTSYAFQAVKLWDYNSRWGELEADDNPFATVVMAHLATKSTRNQAQSRLSFKLQLVRRLYERDYERRQVLELFRFIDWVLALPKELERRFRDEVTNLEKELSMPYVTSIERLGREEGLQEGRREGRREGRQEGRREGRREGRHKGRQEGQQEGQIKVLQQLLARRFEPLPAWVGERLEQASQTELERWTDRILDARNLDEVFATS